jgi:DNA modification methylase
MLAFAMRNAGWYLRSDIIWAKPNPIPEPVKDRPTRAHEYIFLFSKNRKYYYDYDAVKERTVDGTGWRNPRDVWFITPRQYRGEHIAVFPYEIPERCILAATRVGDTVLDPFVGSGTVCEVARKLERNSIGIELSERYFNIAAKLMSITTLEDFDG